MPVLVALLALVFPRIALLAVWLFVDGYLIAAVGSFLWLVLGFLFLPLTTLAFAYATNTMAPAGAVPDLGWVVVALGGAFDLGIIGRSARRRRRD